MKVTFEFDSTNFELQVFESVPITNVHAEAKLPLLKYCRYESTELIGVEADLLDKRYTPLARAPITTISTITTAKISGVLDFFPAFGVSAFLYETGDP